MYKLKNKEREGNRTCSFIIMLGVSCIDFYGKTDDIVYH